MMEYHSIYALLLYRYITFKRSFGFKFSQEYALKLIDDFFYDIDAKEIGITRAEAEKYCKKHPNESDANHAARINCMHGFSRFLIDAGYHSFVPRNIKFHSTFIPKIFTQDEMAKIFAIADTLKSQKGSNCHHRAIPVIIRILYATGMRAGEVVSLTISDINLKAGTILIRGPKSGKNRKIPVSDSMLEILREYSTRFNVGASATQCFFRRPNGQSCNRNTIYRLFRKVLEEAGIPHLGRGGGPRLHDLRHTFSVHSFAMMADAGIDLYYSLPLLSTYLGHSNLHATEGYIRLTEEMYPGIIADSNKIAPSIFPEVSHE
ncbi:MAG: tyrosine-type recombinase/integrase [Spirochaetales bacterium]|nr:tyrosine-type recombinase/integrase [Spirochaetales bacterium]